MVWQNLDPQKARARPGRAPSAKSMQDGGLQPVPGSGCRSTALYPAWPPGRHSQAVVLLRGWALQPGASAERRGTSPGCVADGSTDPGSTPPSGGDGPPLKQHFGAQRSMRHPRVAVESGGTQGPRGRRPGRHVVQLVLHSVAPRSSTRGCPGGRGAPARPWWLRSRLCQNPSPAPAWPSRPRAPTHERTIEMGRSVARGVSRAVPVGPGHQVSQDKQRSADPSGHVGGGGRNAVGTPVWPECPATPSSQQAPCPARCP